MKKRLLFIVLPAVALVGAPINIVDYTSLTGTQLITFEDVVGGPAPGTNYDVIFESGNTAFAERFVGQTLAAAGDFDDLSGVPLGPLALQVGAPGQNINIYDRAPLPGGKVLDGLGPLGFPDFGAIGEGAFALLFDFDQSEFGFQLVGGDSGSAVVSFFRRDGFLIDAITLTGLADAFYGFQREGSVRDIAGISIDNNDPGGVGFNDLKHDVAGVPDSIPEPGTVLLLASGLAAVLAWRRSTVSSPDGEVRPGSL